MAASEKVFAFTLPIQVLAKHDGGDGGKLARRHMPPKKKANAKAIQALAMPYRPQEPLTGPIRLDLCFVFPQVKGSVYGDPHVATPDLTNLVKQVEDALEGMFYVNDKQVCCGTHAKVRGDSAKVRVRIQEIAPTMMPYVLTSILGQEFWDGV